MQPGGYSGYDKGLSILAQYGLTSEHTYKGRGVLLCQTQQGLKMIRPYEGNVQRLESIYKLLEHLKDAGHKRMDQFLRNEEGNLVSTDKDGLSYVVKDWWELRECDARSGNDVIKAVRVLADLHKDMYLEESPATTEEKQVAEKAANLQEVYRRRNQELKKIREFIRKRKQKNIFEYMYLEHVPRYMEYAEAVLRKLESSSYGEMRHADIKRGTVCHNACTQHNFLMGKSCILLVNFDHYCYDNHMADLAQFMRKVLEKHGWNRMLAQKMIQAYDNVHPLDTGSYEQLMLRLAYPEKFWKIANFYYNHNKSFFPERNILKLAQQMENEKNWQNFVQELS